MVNFRIQENQFTDPDTDQTVTPEEFLRMAGAAQTISIIRQGDSYRLSGVFTIGNRRTLSLISGIFTLEEGHTKIFPRLKEV